MALTDTALQVLREVTTMMALLGMLRQELTGTAVAGVAVGLEITPSSGPLCLTIRTRRRLVVGGKRAALWLNAEKQIAYYKLLQSHPCVVRDSNAMQGLGYQSN